MVTNIHTSLGGIQKTFLRRTNVLIGILQKWFVVISSLGRKVTSKHSETNFHNFSKGLSLT